MMTENWWTTLNSKLQNQRPAFPEALLPPSVRRVELGVGCVLSFLLVIREHTG